MAFDGIMVHAVTEELSRTLLNARINKIAQPEPEELLFTLKTENGLQKMLISANASLPLIYLTEENKVSPQTAPGFCMLLRKHLNSARITGIYQPGLERVLRFSIEHIDEMGDLREKRLYVEIMGKYSNIIFTDENDRIIDAIKRVPPSVSSVRTVLPGGTYFIPETQGKKDGTKETLEGFLSGLDPKDRLGDALFRHYTGFSMPSVTEFLEKYHLDGDRFVSALSDEERLYFGKAFLEFTSDIMNCPAAPEIAYDLEGLPVAFSAVPLLSYKKSPEKYRVEAFSSPSVLLTTYFSGRNIVNNMRQRSQDMRKIAETLMDRAVKKQDLQLKQYKDTEKMDKLRLQGELLQAYSYSLPVGEKSVWVLNYYDNTEMEIPTDPDLSIADNAKRCFDKYTKLKRTKVALDKLLPETAAEIDHLSTILLAIEQARDIDALSEIREEMAEAGYIRKSGDKKKQGKIKSRPYHYISSDGFHIYVGKNNFQNDALTFRFAENHDIFMHAKNAPGSHVIIKTEGREIPDRTYEEAGALAAYYSSLRGNPKAEIDYVEKKQVKKPAAGKPGFVVYYTNYSLIAAPDIGGIRLLEG